MVTKKARFVLENEIAQGWAEVAIERPNELFNYYSVITVTNTKVLPRLALTGKSYAVHNTRVTQYCFSKPEAKSEFDRQTTRLLSGGWVKNAISKGK